MEKYDNYIISAIKEIPATQEEFLQLKKKLSKQYKIPIALSKSADAVWRSNAPNGVCVCFGASLIAGAQ